MKGAAVRHDAVNQGKDPVFPNLRCHVFFGKRRKEPVQVVRMTAFHGIFPDRFEKILPAPCLGQYAAPVAGMKIDKLIRVHIDVIQVNTASGRWLGTVGIHSSPPHQRVQQRVLFFCSSSSNKITHYAIFFNIPVRRALSAPNPAAFRAIKKAAARKRQPKYQHLFCEPVLIFGLFSDPGNTAAGKYPLRCLSGR